MTAFACPLCGVAGTTPWTLRTHLTGAPPGHRLPEPEAEQIIQALDAGVDPHDERIRRGPGRLKAKTDWCTFADLPDQMKVVLREMLPRDVSQRRPRPALILADADNRRWVEAVFFGQDLGLWGFATAPGLDFKAQRSFEAALRELGWGAPEDALPESGDLGWHYIWPPDVAVETVTSDLIQALREAFGFQPTDHVLVSRGNTAGAG